MSIWTREVLACNDDLEIALASCVLLYWLDVSSLQANNNYIISTRKHKSMSWALKIPSLNVDHTVLHSIANRLYLMVGFVVSK